MKTERVDDPYTRRRWYLARDHLVLQDVDDCCHEAFLSFPQVDLLPGEVKQLLPETCVPPSLLGTAGSFRWT